MDESANRAREIFSSRLREMRKQAGFRSARALAQVLGIDENRYTRYERAEVEPNLQLIVRICGELHTSPNTLLGFEAGGAGPDRAQQPPGFAEGASQAGFEAASGHGRSAQPPSPDAQTPDAAYWHVAELVADLMLADTAAPSSDLQRLSAASQVFTRIKADPFGFAAEVVNDPAVKQAPAGHQDQLAERLSAAIQLTVDRAGPT
jgi:transcriptional regulator with XRE-family HTH domain